MKVPARCNKRTCQARRNLSKPLKEYVRHPKCHVPGCGGLMYVDTYRLNKGAKDRAPECTDPYCGFKQRFFERTGRIPPRRHRVDNAECDHAIGHQIERSLINSKHRPFRDTEAF